MYYSAEINVQMLIAILKANHIKKVVASPGTTNLNFVTSLKYDGSFEMYSCPEERSAAYMACGLSAESGEPVVLTCTGASASRDYMPGLTEAFYRKLPVLAVTASQVLSNAWNLSPQFIDRTSLPKDLVRLSVHLQPVKDQDDKWDCNLKINRAVQELFRHGGGPVHINLSTTYNNDFSVEALPDTRVIRRHFSGDTFPTVNSAGRIAVSIGAHSRFTEEETSEIERFCENYNAVVLIDHSSDYHGKYSVLPTMLASQEGYRGALLTPDLLIHLGEQSGDYYTYGRLMKSKEVWRVSEDGEMRDTFHHLTHVFEMPVRTFFESYNRLCTSERVAQPGTYHSELSRAVQDLYQRLPELPFSNVWLAKELSGMLPEKSVIHFGVSNTMRSWTFFELPETVSSKANVGCRGIDGAVSTLIGASLSDPGKLHFLVLGDLTFFYDMNVLGNRHVGNNVRILLVNNGRGGEFHIYHHRAYKLLGDDSDEFVAAGGHNGDRSPDLVKHYAQDLGFEYLTASSKEELLQARERFLTPEETDRPMLLEVFTDVKDERQAVYLMKNIIEKPNAAAKETMKKLLGEKGVKAIKKVVKK